MGLTTLFDDVDRLIEHELEQNDSLGRIERALTDNLGKAADAHELARLYAYLAQVQFFRYEYESDGSKARREIAKRGAELAKKALELDERSLWANAWGAATLGIAGLEEGILSVLQYLPQIEALAKRVVALDESYNFAMGHQTLGGLYRLAPPWPISLGDKKKSLHHLERGRQLAPTCPECAISYAETQIARRRKDEARQALRFVLDTTTVIHGPRFMEKKKAKASELMKKL